MKNKLLIIALLFIIFEIASASVYNDNCETDEYCIAEYTGLYQCLEKHCIRKWFTFDNSREYIGAIIIVVISMFANAGGLGAGAVIIPVYVFVYGFAVTDSIPLSKITIFAGAISNILFIWNDRLATDKNRFLISYEMAATMIPLLLCGTMIGVLLSKIFPPVLITCLLVMYLLYSTYKMYFKGMQLTKKENADRAKAQSQKDTSTEGDCVQGNSNNNLPSEDNTGHHDSEQLMEEQVDEKSTGELMKFQISNLLILVASYLMVLIIALLRGGEGSESIIGIDKCSEYSWLLLIASQLGGFSLSFFSYKNNLHIYKKEDQGDDKNGGKDSNVQVDLKEMRLREKMRMKVIYMSYITGIAAGTLGIGGGMILGPFMLALGMDPQISTALSGFTVLFTSSSTTSQFTIAGAIHLRHAWVLMIFSLIGSLIGNLILKKIIKKYNRPSLVVWVIFGI